MNNDIKITNSEETGTGESDPLFREPGWSWRQAGEVGWWVRPEWRDELLGSSGLKIDQWRGDGKLTTVKSGQFRVVHRVDLAAGTIFVKHFLVPGLRAKVRQWVRRGKGRNESKRAQNLGRIGIPTIEPIALGEQRKRGFLFENYLITHAVDAALPLDRIVEQSLKDPTNTRWSHLRKELARALGELTARLHNAGILHHDFHPGNLLVNLDDQGIPHLTLIDLDALRIQKRLSPRDIVDNLALLNHYFWVRCTRSDRRRFLEAYLANRLEARPDAKILAPAIESSTRAWAERLWTRWGRRCRGDSKYFKVLGLRRAWCVAARELDDSTVDSLLADLDAPFRHPDTVLLKDSRTTTVAELTLKVGGAPRRVIYKRFNARTWYDPLLNIFRPSRGWRSWEAGQQLASRGIATPSNLAYLVRFRPSPLPPIPRETYLLTLKSEPSRTLADYLANDYGLLNAETRASLRRRLIVSLARLLRTMHDRALSHRDLKGSNVLLEGDPLDPGGPKLCLIDLVGVRKSHPLPWRRRLQNLSRLQVSLWEIPGRTRSDALRFLKEYLPWSSTPRDRWKAIWRAVAILGERKHAKNAKSGRPLA